jgi:lysozyme
MTAEQVAASLIKEFEGCELTSYLCHANKWTIGWGSIKHTDGRPVKEGETITQAQADEYLRIEIERRMQAMIYPASLNANQLGAVISFAYNLGVGAFNASTLRRKMMANPNDPTIRNEFMRWNKAGGKVLRGLIRRRDAEANTYFTKIA